MVADSASPPETASIAWKEKGEERSARWHSAAGVPAPKKVVVADDRITADQAYRLASEGTALLWRSDFQNARQLLAAMARRIDRHPPKQGATPVETFNLYRMAQGQRARTLGRLLIPFDAGHSIPLARAPEVREACTEAWGEAPERYVASLRELLGVVGAHEWRRNGVEIAALGARVYPHYGVFSPVRGEYLDLVAAAPLPAALSASNVAFDVGTGTGVLAALLAKRGIARVVATENEAHALACARDNIARLKLKSTVELVQADLFPPGKAALIVCNPPWLPGRAATALEHAVYDSDSRMLRGFIAGAAAHLIAGGEAWLILSDLAEHLGLRTREQLFAWIDQAGLAVLDRSDVKPRHPKAADEADPLHAARRAEMTSLWRLGSRPG